MRRSRTLVLFTGVAALAAVTPVAVGASPKPQKKTVKVLDNYFTPSKLTVNRGSTITWALGRAGERYPRRRPGQGSSGRAEVRV